MRKLFLIAATAISHLSANVGPQGFSEFLSGYFIETGTFGGDGVQKALDAGFPLVRSMEYDRRHARDSRNRFMGNEKVSIYDGDSSVDLWDMIKDINEPVTFWLDAHIFPPREDGGKNCPLIQELDQIKRHPINTHTILIDDLHCCNTAAFDYLTREDLINKLLEINSNYQISYRDGGNDGEYPNNIMVATYP